VTPPLIGRRALNRALLARQLLLARAELTPEEAIGHLVGMQAQAPGPPYIGLWTRLAGFEFDDLAGLVRRRRVVRMALMRNTVHLVTGADGHRLRAVLQPMMTRSFLSSAFAKQLPGVDIGTVARAGRRAVDEHPMTWGELGSVLARTWPDGDPRALAQVVRAEVALVQVPPRGIWGESGQARHTSLEAWVGPGVGRAASVDDMVLRYLDAFGPASVADIQTWSGLTGLHEVVDRLSGALTVFRDESGVALFDRPDAPRPEPDTPAPLRFVPAYDNLVLSHSDRRRIVDDGDRARLQRANGIVPGTVLVDGFVAGVWKITRTRASATLAVGLMRRLSKPHLAAMTGEGRRLLAAAAATVPSHHVVIEVD
jgi:hypothetical protein